MTWSIHKTIVQWKHLSFAAIAVALFSASGCQFAQPQAPDRVNVTPIAEDDAMRVRNWAPTAAVYPSFSSTAGPSEMLLVPRDNLTPYEHMALETPLYVADLLLIPVVTVEGIVPPPWAQVEATSFYLPPAYTSNPPLEPVNRLDYSGGPGVGWNPAVGRSVNNP